MTATTIDPTTTGRPGPRTAVRFLVAFLAGMLAVLALGAGALYAYERQYEGRILPGIRVGSVDLSGLDPATARQRLASAYSYVGTGAVVLTAGARRTVIDYGDVDRRVDVDALVAAASAIGRSDQPLERVIGEARTVLRGETLEPSVVFDPHKLASRIETAAAALERAPKDASVKVAKAGITMTEGVDGAQADRQKPLNDALAALGRLDTPGRMQIEIPVTPVAPRITTEEAAAGKAAAERIARDIDVKVQDRVFTFDAATIRTWIRAAQTVDGRVVPVLDMTKSRAALKPFAEKVKLAARNASFLVGKNNKVA